MAETERIQIRRGMLAVLSLTLVILLAYSTSAGVAGVEGRFTFNPPQNTSFIEKTVESAVTTDANGNKVTEQIETRTQFSIQKIKTGFRLEITLLSYSLKRSGKACEDRFLAALEGMTLCYGLDRAGVPQTVQGVDEAVQKLKTKYPKIGAADEADFVSALTDQLVLNWQASVSNLVGEDYFLGGICFIQHVYLIPGYRQVPAYYAYELIGEKKASGQNCLEIKYAFDTDPERLLREYGIKPGETEVFQGESKALDVEIKASGFRLQDPRTMLIYSENAEEVAKIWQKGSSKPVITRQSTMHTVYEYSK